MPRNCLYNVKITRFEFKHLLAKRAGATDSQPINISQHRFNIFTPMAMDLAAIGNCCRPIFVVKTG